jgi:formylglycine-generating enzyme required for sulfatase activity
MSTKIFIRIFAAFVFVLFIGCKEMVEKKEEMMDSKWIESQLAKVSDKLYTCKFETTNLEYRIFLKELKANNQSYKYIQSQVDTLNWVKDFKYYESMASTYFQNPAYDEYPVVNITREGAENFCRWLTDKYNSFPKRKFIKVIFRLPTEKEWLMASDWKNEKQKFSLLDKDGHKKYQFYYVNQERIAFGHKSDTFILKSDTPKTRIENGKKILYRTYNETASLSPTLVTHFEPNSLDIYNLLGNVAEMIQEKGITKGGCWYSSGYYLNPYAEDEFKGFTGSSPFIGFRYFMEVVEQ